MMLVLIITLIQLAVMNNYLRIMGVRSPVTPPGIDPETVRLVAQCLNHYDTPGPLSTYKAHCQVYTELKAQ
jgi:hypothetical protein